MNNFNTYKVTEAYNNPFDDSILDIDITESYDEELAELLESYTCEE